MPKNLSILLFLLIGSSSLHTLASKSQPQFFGNFEYGFIAILQHKSQWGKKNPEFNYVKEGGQDVLLPTWRSEAGVILAKKHRMSFLYQPLSIKTEVVLEKDVKIDNLEFTKGTELISTYNFPFYRFSYWYLLSNSNCLDFWIGGGLQIRNTSIKFRNRNGSSAFRTSNIGPVPLFNLMGDVKFTENFTLRTAATGFWAPIKYLNGGSVDVEGWIYEFEVKPTVTLENQLQIFSNFRILGGGAIGNSKKPRFSKETYSKDVFVTMSLTLGLQKII